MSLAQSDSQCSGLLRLSHFGTELCPIFIPWLCRCLISHYIPDLNFLGTALANGGTCMMCSRPCFPFLSGSVANEPAEIQGEGRDSDGDSDEERDIEGGGLWVLMVCGR